MRPGRMYLWGSGDLSFDPDDDPLMEIDTCGIDVPTYDIDQLPVYMLHHDRAQRLIVRMEGHGCY